MDGLSDFVFFGETRAFGKIQYVDRESAYARAEQPLAPLAFCGFDAPYFAHNEYNITGVDIQTGAVVWWRMVHVLVLPKFKPYGR